MDQHHIEYARNLEGKLRPITAAVTAAGGGGCDSHKHPLPGLPDRLLAVPDDLAAIAAWAQTHCPEGKPGRTRWRR